MPWMKKKAACDIFDVVRINVHLCDFLNSVTPIDETKITQAHENCEVYILQRDPH